MRAKAGILSALVVAAVVVACESFGDGATSEVPGVSPDGGDAGTAAETSTDGNGGTGTSTPRACAVRPNALLCEDFESADPLAGWHSQVRSAGTVTLTTDPSRTGKVLRAHLPVSDAQVDALIERAVTWPLPLHARFYAYLDESFSSADYKILFVLKESELGIQGGRVVVNQFNEDKIYKATASPFPVKKWTCVEWAIEPNATKLTVDGVVEVEVLGTPMADADYVGLGLAYHAANAAPNTILLDDLVVSATPVGCD